MKIFRNEEKIEEEFHVSIYIVVYKFTLGLFELSAGIAIALFGTEMYRFFQTSILKELAEDPHDLLARISENTLPGLLARHTYVVVSLIVLGLAKILGAIGLVYKQNWGVDLLVGLTMVMAPFQIISLLRRPNWFDFIYLVVGLLIALYLIEFRPRAWISRISRFKFN